jgi:signal transduction histidine kinase
LQRHRAEVAESYQKKQTEFIDTICHEIRNPLNGIYGNLDIMSDVLEAVDVEKGITKEQLSGIKEALDAIKECAGLQKVGTKLYYREERDGDSSVYIGDCGRRAQPFQA